MSKSRRSSIASPPCRIEWRPSRWQGCALWMLALLAPLGVLASDLPAAWAWPLALAVCLRGGVLARRHRRQPPLRLVIPSGRGQATCDGAPMQVLMVSWRGPLAFLAWRDAGGRGWRRSLWPDVLDAAARRELKLAMQRRDGAPPAASMAGCAASTPLPTRGP